MHKSQTLLQKAQMHAQLKDLQEGLPPVSSLLKLLNDVQGTPISAEQEKQYKLNKAMGLRKRAIQNPHMLPKLLTGMQVTMKVVNLINYLNLNTNIGELRPIMTETEIDSFRDSMLKAEEVLAKAIEEKATFWTPEQALSLTTGVQNASILTERCDHFMVSVFRDFKDQGKDFSKKIEEMKIWFTKNKIGLNIAAESDIDNPYSQETILPGFGEQQVTIDSMMKAFGLKALEGIEWIRVVDRVWQYLCLFVQIFDPDTSEKTQ